MDQLGQRPPRQHAHAPLRRPAAPNDAISPPPTPDPSNIGLGQRHTFPVSGPYKHLPLSHSDPDDDFFGDGRARTSLAAVGRHERPSTPRAEGPAHGDGAESLRGTPKRQGSHPIRPYVDHEVDVGGPQSHSRAHIRTYAEDQRVQAYPRLSKPVELMRGSYDCVVVGSGYGGAIAASRMARTESQTVCVLECGREKWPGEYPVGMFEAAKELRVSGDLEVAPGILPGKMVDGGNPTGMYHLIMGKGQNAVVCNGLGGTSLINANVFMEADKDTLGMPVWPKEIRSDPSSLDPYYERVADVLEPKEYPEDWPSLPKLNTLKKQAEYLGYANNFHRVRQTTRFHNGPNSCGVEMAASALTGQDATGVNDGSKTTTLVTYLADAWNWGAEMFCECEVRYIEKARDREGYIVYFAWHGRNRGHFRANLHGDLMWVHARKAVFLGAGAIGTTEILLRSKAMGLGMSPLVGQNMSGNGDMLAFGYNTDEPVNAIGRSHPSPYNPIGPTINGVIDCREGHDNPLDGFIIEEGAVPQALSCLLQTMLHLMPGAEGPENEGIIHRTQAALAHYGSRILGPYFKNGAVERTQVYLIMSHDSNQAFLSLKDDKPVLEFVGVGRSDHVKTLNRLLERATRAVGGTLVQSPFFALMGQEVTVHPIGGACMARDNTGSTGVTNHVGEVFTGRGSETHDGLVVTDGAIIPTALGANPFATIAALAERSVEHYAVQRGLSINAEKNGLLDLFGEPKHAPSWDAELERISKTTVTATEADSEHSLDLSEELDAVYKANDEIHKAAAVKASGFGFTEIMSGFIHHDENMKDDRKETYQLAARIARSQCESARFFLSVQAFDTGNIVNNAQHRGMLTGTFVCPTIPGSPFMVQRGGFNLFIVDHKAPGTRNLTYDFDMRGINGKKLHMHGYKVVDSSVAMAPWQFWKATSTLYVTVSEWAPGTGNGECGRRTGKVLAKGMMHIQPGDFMSEIMTLAPTGSNIFKKVYSAAAFLTFFTRKSLSLLLAPLTPLQYPSQSYSGFINNTAPTRSEAIEAQDGVVTRLHVWEPTAYPHNDRSQIRNLFMVPGASVDHQIFATPTIPFNAVNYFARAGYRVYVAVHRIGQLMVAEHDWTTYDARLDLKACLDFIRQDNGIVTRKGEVTAKEDRIYTITHCMGGVAFSSGLLDGTIPGHWIAGISASQVFMNPIWATLNMAKAVMGPIPMDRLYRMLAGNWFSCSTSRDDSLVQRAVNQLLRLYPDARKELCNSACCHRISLVFGRCWNHRNLNEATHRQIHRFFGGVNMTCENLLMRMGRHGAVMRNGPLFEPLTSAHNVRRLRGIPILLWVGADNAVLSPESTERSYEVLCDTFGSGRPAAGGAANAVGGEGDGVEYRRRVVPEYGHLDGWMGRNAWRDVYPMVREELDRVVRGEDYVFREPDDKFKRLVESGQLNH